MRLRGSIVGSLSLLLLMWLTAGCVDGLVTESQACSCLPSDPEVDFAQADVVFSGVMRRSRLLPLPDSGLIRARSSEYEFSVDHVWKGPNVGRLKVQTGPGGGMCGFEFRPHERYLVYAWSRRGVLSTGLCTRTGEMRRRLWDLYVLGQPRVRRSFRPLEIPTTEKLIESLTSRDGGTRYAAAEAVGHIRTDRAALLQELGAVVRGGQTGGPTAALEALGWFGRDSRPALPDIQWALRHGAPETRTAALRALFQVADRPAFFAELVTALEDTSLVVASASLGYAHVPADSSWREQRLRLMPGVLGLLDRPDGSLRYSTARLLIDRYPEAADSLETRLTALIRDESDEHQKKLFRDMLLELRSRKSRVRD